MTLFLNEGEVAQLLPMGECIQAMEEVFIHAGGGLAELKLRSQPSGRTGAGRLCRL